jgi:hypothetical protein
MHTIAKVPSSAPFPLADLSRQAASKGILIAAAGHDLGTVLLIPKLNRQVLERSESPGDCA